MIANSTTKIPVEKSLSEIQGMLIKVRARTMMIDYEDGQPSALAFELTTRSGMNIRFRLPANWRGVLAAMNREKKRGCVSEEQAKRTSWRIVRDWLRAQLSIVESGAIKIEEVLLPYAITRGGIKTVSQLLLDAPNSVMCLPAPEEQVGPTV